MILAACIVNRNELIAVAIIILCQWKWRYGEIYHMLILNEKETCPYGQKCPNKKSEGSENGLCNGLNPLRTYVFKCDLVKEDGTIEVLEYLMMNRNKTFG
jgi:hypothetical protein